MAYGLLADSAAQLLELTLYLTAEILIIKFFHIAAKIYPQEPLHNKIFSVGKCLHEDKDFCTFATDKIIYCCAAYAQLPYCIRAYNEQHMRVCCAADNKWIVKFKMDENS